MKKIILTLIIAAAHFMLSKSVPAMTLLLMDAGISRFAVIHIFAKLLVTVTKVLYFPMLSFALYSRQWFPGHWINSVIFLNSLLWAIVIVLAIALYRRFRT